MLPALAARNVPRLRTMPEPIETDAVVIGAGPVGLFAVFQLGLLEIKTQLLDVLPHVGGQCIELYPDKPIYDIPGILRCTGAQLIEQLQRQIEPFAVPRHLGFEVTQFAPLPDGRYRLATSAQTFICRCVLIAAGIGAFAPRTLALPGLARFDGTQVQHRLDLAQDWSGQQLVLVGGDESAIDSALALAALPAAQRPAGITLLHRRDWLSGVGSAAAQRLRPLCETGQLRFLAGQLTDIETAGTALSTGASAHGERLVALRLTHADGSTQRLPVDCLLLLLGLSPRLGPLAHWGLALARKQLVVDPATFATSQPGVFAVGDINSYPGKRKLIVCGFHEATLAAYAAAEWLRPGPPVRLQYTTSSTHLQQLLGVAGD